MQAFLKAKRKTKNNHRLRIQFNDDRERVMRSFSCAMIIIDDKLHARFRPCRFGEETGIDSVGSVIGLSDGIEMDNDRSRRRYRNVSFSNFN